VKEVRLRGKSIICVRPVGLLPLAGQRQRAFCLPSQAAHQPPVRKDPLLEDNLRTGAATVVPLRAPSASEPWLTKNQLATRLHVSPRWIDYRRCEGMPCRKWAGIVRFRISEVEAWLERRAA
jgi:hypothetical protein